MMVDRHKVEAVEMRFVVHLQVFAPLSQLNTSTVDGSLQKLKWVRVQLGRAALDLA